MGLRSLTKRLIKHFGGRHKQTTYSDRRFDGDEIWTRLGEQGIYIPEDLKGSSIILYRKTCTRVNELRRLKHTTQCPKMVKIQM